MAQFSDSKRETVLERDDHECRFCGMTEEEHHEEYQRSLDIHHIIPRRCDGSNNPENLIAVCVTCHRTLESTQANAIERLDERKQGAVSEEKYESLKEKVNTLRERHDAETTENINNIRAFDRLLGSTLTVTLYAVHETRVNTSRLLYIGTNSEKAYDIFESSEYHSTMETTSVTINDWISEFDQRTQSQVREHSGIVADRIEMGIEQTWGKGDD